MPPCQDLIGVSSDDAGTGESNPDLADDGLIATHQGVLGADMDLLPVVHGWTDPVATVVIERVS